MKKTDRKSFKLYRVPSMLLVLGLAVAVAGLVYPIPEAGQMQEVRGELAGYYFKRNGRRESDYTTILILEDSSRIWTNLITKENAAAFLSENGLEIRTHINPESIAIPIDGALKSFGLSVDGKDILSLEDALREEWATLRRVFPALGMITVIAAFVIYRKEKTREDE